MDRVQRKSQPNADLVIQRKEAGRGASTPSPASGDEIQFAGGAPAASVAWEADAGLMDAMGLVQHKLEVGAEDEGMEREADEVADSFARPEAAAGAAPAAAEAGAAAAAATPSAAPASGMSVAGEEEGEGEEAEETPEQRHARKNKDRDKPGAAAPAAGVQHQTTLGGAPIGSASVHEAAAAGVSGGGGALPHLDAIQHSFGSHDVSSVSAHTGGEAATANASMGSEAYATGNSVAFGSSSPSLHTAAHEAAHVVQQRGGVQLKGGVGEAGDTYEQHADAVADRVVAGKSAQGLLDQYAGGSGGGGVQQKLIQFDIKADLRTAMSGLGTDEDAIYARIGRATPEEVQGVVRDAALMAELRDELTVSEMERALDLLHAPLAMKLRIAISGWINDHDYITRSMNTAQTPDLLACGQDAVLVRELTNTLSTTFLKSVLDRLQAPLTTKLEIAFRGWGVDDAYISRSITLATNAEATALAGDAAMLARIEAEVATVRPTLARKIYPGGSGDVAFSLLQDADNGIQAGRVREYGGLDEQRAMLDDCILNTTNAIRAQRAFHEYWNVEISSAPAVAATTNGGRGGGATAAVEARDWPIPTLQGIHRALKNIPDQDTRTGFWGRLSLTSSPALINSAAYGGANPDGTNGNFSVGSGADITTAPIGGYFCKLTAPSTATELTVDEPDRFNVGDALRINGAGLTDNFTIQSKAGNTWTVTALTNSYAADSYVQPTDGSAARRINWLDATVRHEIAHSLDGGAINTRGFYSKGDWALGDGEAGYNMWIAGMGGEGAAYACNDGTVVSDTAPATPRADGSTLSDRAMIKAAIIDHVSNQKGSLFAAFSATPAHPIMAHQAKAVPLIQAAEASLIHNDQFYNHPASLYAKNGKRFTVSWWYKRFQQHNEAVVSQRVANYGLYSPTEFFAEAYTVYYEERGRPGITPDMYGRLIRNSEWRQWITDNVHNRGLAPASGSGTPPTAPTAPGPEADVGTAQPGGGSTGKAAGNPGM